MGSLHAWESVGDGAVPDIQAVAKGLGGGYVAAYLCKASSNDGPNRYASIGAVLLSPKVARGIRGGSGLLKHGHTYQVARFFLPNTIT